jgi:hypothetical protein
LYCKSPKVKLNGKSPEGKQRYLCLHCGKTYLWKLSKPLEARRYNWFRLWITEGYNVRQITMIKKISRATLQRVIHYWLKQAPVERAIAPKNVKYLIFDGTYLRRPRGIYAAMNSETHRIIKADPNMCETGKELLGFYTQLSESGLHPKSATIDGNIQQSIYLRKVWPEIKLQRCIVHVQRQGLSWLRKKPKRTESRELREIFLKLTDVHNKQDAIDFTKAVHAWEKRFGGSIARSENRGKVFSDLMRARSMLLKALPDLFHYLDDPKIPRTTNALEGYFSRLKEHYRLHRGLTRTNRNNYFIWYFYLKSK